MNQTIYEKAKSLCGEYITGPVSDAVIEKAEKELGLRFPDSYRSFLRNYGEGGVIGVSIIGLEEDFAGVVKYTKKYRESLHLPPEYAVIKLTGSKYVDWALCLDTKRMKNGECPVVKIDLATGKIREYKKNFDHLLDTDMERVYLKAISSDEVIEHPELPDGMGYKTCWMMIEGASQIEIADVLLKGEKEEKEYRQGLEVVSKASYQEHKVMITSDYRNCNYIIGDALHKLFFNYDKLKEVLRDTYRIILFATNRVSEIYGFAYFLHGSMKRLFYYSEEELINEGAIRLEEEKLGYNLPHSFEEIQEHRNDDIFTTINEDMIVKLARKQIGINVNEYPYENVIVGELDLD